MQDIPRMASHWGIPLSWPPDFKPQSTRAMCLATALHSSGICQEEFVDTATKRLWVEKDDLEAPITFTQLLTLAGLESFNEEQALSDLTKNSVHAFESGIFGVPTFRSNEQIFFGADRMEMMAKRLGVSAS